MSTCARHVPRQEKSRSSWDSPWATWLAGGLIVLAGWAAYANSFSGTFIFDDLRSIPDNPTIQHLWPLSTVFSPPSNGETVSGRPILNLSFALNYALSGTSVWGYHFTNLIIHLFNGLLLLGILRRTFSLPALQLRFGRNALSLASVIALLWVVHPLQTESVTYMVQRAESLAALFYLLVLYAVIRGSQSGRTTLWFGLAVAACCLGLGAKEIVATAPVMVLLYDRALLAGSFRQALRQRGKLYLGLAASWAVLLGLMLQRGFVTKASNPGLPDSWAYASTQPGVILHYLHQIVWPHPLCLDWGWLVAEGWSAVGPMLVIGLVLAATIWGLRRNNAWGLLGAWFFLILAPTSSFVPLIQLASDHRMYLPLVAVMALLVIGIYRLSQRWNVRGAQTAGRCLVILVATTLGFLTFQRNRDYRDGLSIWADVVAKIPGNPAGHHYWGLALVDAGRFPEAIEQFKQALQCPLPYVNPRWAAADPHRGVAAARLSCYTEAVAQANARWAATYFDRGAALAQSGRYAEAIEQYQQAIQLHPNFAEVQNNWGAALMSLNRGNEAIEHYRRAIELQNDFFKPHYNLFVIFAQLGRIREAVEEGQQADRLSPHQPKLIALMAWLLATHDASDGGNPTLALQWAQRAMALTQGHDGECAESLAAAYAATGDFSQAIALATQTQQVARSAGLHPLAARIDRELSRYHEGKPYRDPPLQTAQNHP